MKRPVVILVRVLTAGWALLALPAEASQTTLALSITNAWSYTTNNLDSENWRAPGYAESGWSNASPALLFIEDAALPAPKNTPLPQRPGGGPMLTYYFRTSFQVTNAAAVTSLTFSNLLDDGAVFYLNGTEVQRVGMAAGAVNYTNLASRTVTDATGFDVFTLSGAALAGLVEGSNVLAVEVHQVNATSSDVVFGTALLAQQATNLLRGPYLQNGSATNVVVRWRTDALCDTRVRFGTNLANLNQVADAPAVTNEHEINLTGLLPDTEYFYAIGTTAETLAGGDASHFVLTAPTPGTRKPTRIWVLGDSGTADTNAVAVRNAYYTFTGARHTDLWLMLGDNAYPSGTDAEYQAAVFNMYPDLLRKSVLWPTIGNHETYSTNPNGHYAYLDIFTLPTAGEAGGLPSGTERYYSFDYANVHFICLDSMTVSRAPTGAMALWLTNDLANVTADWTIAFWHHPPYSKGSHNSDAETELIQMRADLLPLLEAGGVDLVLCGHSHSYERSFLLDGHYGLSASLSATNQLDAGNGREGGTGAYTKPSGGPVAHQGAVYAVCGSSGQTSGGTLNHPAMFISLNNLGSMVLDIRSNRLDALFLRETGATNDSFTVVKLNYPPVASNLLANVNGDMVSGLALAGSDINRDPITFLTNSLPAHGLLTGFNPLTGDFSYWPAHGYNGPDGFTFRTSDGQTSSAPATVSLIVLPPADTNSNGLPDDWEAAFGATDPAADEDQDGQSNLAEYYANTNPTNAASYLRIETPAPAGGGSFVLTWPAVGGTRYRVNFSDGDANGGFNGVFTEVARTVTEEMNPAPLGTATTQGFTDDFTLTGGPPAHGARYFRIRVVQ